MAWTAPYLSSTASALVGLQSGPFTITCWFEPTVSGETYAATPFLSGPAWSISLNAAGKVAFFVNNSASDVSTTVTSSAVIIASWNFVAVTYDPGAMVITIWLNGVPTSTTLLALADSTVSTVSTFGDFELGNPGLVSSPAPNGFALDETGVWARVLSSADLGEVYNSGQGNSYPFLGGPFSLIWQANLVNETPTPLIICSQDSVFNIGETTQSSSSGPDSLQAFFNLLFQGAAATPGYNWSADNFSDKVILAQHDNPALYWTPPSPTALLLPGLTVGQNQYDGVAVFQNHILLWSADNLIWSDVDNFTCFIPIAETAVSAVLTLTQPFTQPPPGGSVVVQVATPLAVVSSLSISGDMTFSSTDVGQTSQALLLLENTGNAPISVTGIALPDGFTGNFVGTIAVGTSQDVIITFSPTDAITYSGSVVVGSSATTGTTVYPISGIGTAVTAVINLSGILAFGNVTSGSTLSSSLVVTNSGNSTLNISSVTLPSGFTTTFTTGTVSAGDILAIPITFAPTANLLYTGDITVNSNATSGTNFIVASGTGVKSITFLTAFVTDNGTCQFGDVTDGDSVTGTITITNVALPGAARYLLVYQPTAPPGFTAGPPGVEAPTILHAGDSTTLTVTFSPTAAQSYAGIITVPCYSQTGQPAEGSVAVEVTGIGTATGAIIEVSGSLNYGDVPFGSSLDAMLSIYNPGSVNLTISSITYPSNFSGPSSATVAPGQTYNALVTFTPAASGGTQINYSGDITITSNASNLPTATYPVSGSGIPLPTATPLVADQVVTLTDTSTSSLTPFYNYYTVTAMTGNSLSLTLMDLTGATPSGHVITANGVQFFTVDANEAGSAVVAGARMNGPIFQIIPQGDFAYIFKERSIQSIQYTGLGNGTFYIHNEISGEGLIGRNAVTDSGDGRMFFLGWKELYLYEGGPKPQAVCQQYTRQLYAEIDRTNLNAVLLFHNENRKEIWIIYPIPGGTFKVLIWNYVEDSAAIDIYDSSLMFTAIGWVDWSSDPTWAQLASPDLANQVTWAQLPASTDWDTFVGASVNHAPVFGSADNGLRLHGTVYDREGQGYTALSETMDYDLGAPDNFKYVDVVVLALQVSSLVAIPEGATMYVQVGTQAALGGGDITWTDPFPVLVDGTAPLPVKVNPGGSGRYVRLRFYSTDPDVQWRISQFEVHCRPGGFY